MPRINPTISKEAEAIYNKVPHFERGKFVSDAIIEKDQRSREQNKYITREEHSQQLLNLIDLIEKQGERIHILECKLERWGNK